jgi:hypothetical protein
MMREFQAHKPTTTQSGSLVVRGRLYNLLDEALNKPRAIYVYPHPEATHLQEILEQILYSPV